LRNLHTNPCGGRKRVSFSHILTAFVVVGFLDDSHSDWRGFAFPLNQGC
jgi:hypothetical protein